MSHSPVHACTGRYGHCVDANSLRYFLEVARTGRLVAAGENLAVNHTTVGRQITALERSCGQRLFDRRPTGWTLTESGQEMVIHAEAVEAAVRAAGDIGGAGGGRLSGTVRIRTPDGFGAFVLAPHLGDLHSRHPDLNIEIVTATGFDALSMREFDVGVTLDPPSPSRVAVDHLMTYHLGLYASAGYLESRPPIAQVRDLYQHTLIGYVESLLDVPALRLLDELLPDHRTRIQTNNLTGQWEAAAAGIGIAVLPEYMGGRDHRLRQILPQTVSLERSYWLVVPRELQRLARIRVVSDALRSIAAASGPDARSGPAVAGTASRVASSHAAQTH
ncbi:LysR family transcriptional regulator [Mycolicibacterium canariasense]|nr:LysR family transcriptional regulator [Mycolicibacterium canariasense]